MNKKRLDQIYDKLVQLSSKIIHINSPNLPEFIWRRYKTFHNSINHIGKREKDKYIHLRNTESIRNNLIDVVVTMTLSPKTKRYDKYPKIDAKKFRYLDMVAKSFANYNMTDDAIEAAAHLMPDNMGMIYDLGEKIYLEDPTDPKKAKKVLIES